MEEEEEEEGECSAGECADEEVPAEVSRHIAADGGSQVADAVSLQAGAYEGSGKSRGNEGIGAEGAEEVGGGGGEGGEVEDGGGGGP